MTRVESVNTCNVLVEVLFALTCKLLDHLVLADPTYTAYVQNHVSSQCRTVIDVILCYPRKLQGGLWTCGLALGRGFTASKCDPQVMPLLA